MTYAYEWSVEKLAENFTEEELYDWAMRKEELKCKLQKAVISYENSIKDLKESIKQNEEFTDKLWKAKYLAACKADEKES